MAIEALLERVAAALERNADILEAGIAAVKTNKQTTVSEPEKGEVAAAAPKTTRATAGKKATKALPTLDEVKVKFGDYLNKGPGGDKKVADREANMKAINEFFNVERITKAKPEQWVEAIKLLDAYIAGEDPLAGDGAPATEEDGSALV